MKRFINENALVDGLQTEDNKAIQYMYDTYKNGIFKFVTDNKGSTEDADDLFQEALLATIKNLKRGKFEKSAKLSTYFYSIARYKWLTVLKKRGRSGQLIDSDNELDFIELSQQEYQNQFIEEEKNDKIKMIANSLAKLKQDCRELLIAFYYEKKNMKQLAKRYNYTEGFVRVKKNRCMESLRTTTFKNYKNE